jgi:HK97 family phage major capsid protein
MVLGARSERERFALSIGTDSAGGYTVPTSLGAVVIDALRAESVFTKAGAQVVPLTGSNNKIARIATDPAPTWRAENAAVATSDMTFEGIELQPKTLAVIVRASRELLEDSLNINAAIGTSLSAAFAAEVDRVAGWGNGTNEPLGISGTAGVSTITASANGDVLDDYGRLLDALYVLQGNNVQPNAVILSPRESRAINGFADTTEQPLRTPKALETLPFYVSSRVPTNETQGTSSDAATILMGDFTKLLLGVRSEFRIEVLKERYADNYQYGFLCHLRMDVAALHPKAFAKIVGVIEA